MATTAPLEPYGEPGRGSLGGSGIPASAFAAFGPGQENELLAACAASRKRHAPAFKVWAKQSTGSIHDHE